MRICYLQLRIRIPECLFFVKNKLQLSFLIARIFAHKWRNAFTRCMSLIVTNEQLAVMLGNDSLHKRMSRVAFELFTSL